MHGERAVVMNDKKLRVMFVHNHYRSEFPSGEDHVVEQESALLDRAGHEVIYFERRSDDIADMSLIEKSLVPLRVPWNSSVRAELRQRLLDARPDVVHIHNTFPLLSPSVLAACADADVPAVATLHNYYMVCPTGTMMRLGRRCTECVGGLPFPAVRHGCYRGSRLATVPLAVNMVANRKRWLSQAVRLFCVSDAQREALVSAGVPAARLAVKHHFVPDPVVRRAGPGDHVLYLGRMTVDKGVRLLQAAWESLGGALGVPLVLAGDGPLAENVASWAARRSDVRYVGLLDKNQRDEIAARSVALVAPSQARETFGLVLVEAMAVGVPVVAAAHGGFLDVVRDRVTGLLHAPGDAESLAQSLRHVVLDGKLNQAMGFAARQAYEARFSPNAGLTALVGAYRAAIEATDANGNARVRNGWTM